MRVVVVMGQQGVVYFVMYRKQNPIPHYEIGQFCGLIVDQRDDTIEFLTGRGRSFIIEKARIIELRPTNSKFFEKDEKERAI